MSNNLYSPQDFPTFTPASRTVEQSKFETTLEVLFTSTGRVRARNSGLWSPPRRVRLLEAAVTMRVPAPIQYRLITNTGQILASTFYWHNGERDEPRRDPPTYRMAARSDFELGR
jgi:hypothetical protein